ncbi:MAG: sacsin N-terminal ATP-binding-like domain-containing protein [Streptosporangiaceae bacterium]
MPADRAPAKVAVDYAAIRAENVARYGWDTAVLDLLGQLYSDRSHFLFELIQNAEDAGATAMWFELFADRLQVRHDGRPFTADDVRAICGVGHGTKAGDLTKIGKFGIGFKSVYAYTDSPRIHSGEVHFRIEAYVHPHPVAQPSEHQPGQHQPGQHQPDQDAAASTTLFVFPFDRAGVPAEVAAAEIAAGLDALSGETLLFLRSVERIESSGHLVPGTVLRRRLASRPGAGRQVIVSRRQAGRQADQEWAVWQRPLTALGEPGLRAEIALPAWSGPNGTRLTPSQTSRLVVWFPTEKETFLGFLIQGPYRTTPARDNVPEHDPWNQELARQTAALLIDALADLRDANLLTTDVLQSLPLEEDRFGPGTMLRPLFEAARDALATQPLIPVANGGYAAAPGVRLAAVPGLGDLLDADLLGQICGSPGPVALADESVTAEHDPQLWHYLREVVGVAEVTPDAVLDGCTAEFLAARSDEWTGALYRFLDRNRALWREPSDPGEEPGPARSAPILRLEDGTQVPPFDTRGRPAAYLPAPALAAGLPERAAPGAGQPEPHGPTAGARGFPGGPVFATVRRSVAGQPGARRFLEALGLTEPDIVAEVLDHVLPRYVTAGPAAPDPAAVDPAVSDPAAVDPAVSDPAAVDLARHEADLELIARALAQAPLAGRERLLTELSRTEFVLAENAGTGQFRLLRPGEVYLRTADLELYFDGNPAAWLSADSYGPWLAQLREVGVRDAVRPRARRPDHLGYVPVADEFARHERGLAGFDPAASLDGLEHALANPAAERSEYVWNTLLVPARHLIAGVVERSPRESFDDATASSLLSPIGESAARAAWLPAPDGSFRRPADIDLADLPPGFARDEGLAQALGMIKPVIDDAERQLGFPPGFLRRLSAHPDLIERIERELRFRGDPGQSAGAGQ